MNGDHYNFGAGSAEFDEVAAALDRDVVLNARTMSDATLGNIISNLQSKDMPVPVDISAEAAARGLIVTQ